MDEQEKKKKKIAEEVNAEVAALPAEKLEEVTLSDGQTVKFPKSVVEAIIAAQNREPTYDEILSKPADPNPEFKPTHGVEELVAQAFEEISGRSFAGRHPHLGKMIKCPICLRRHRSVDPVYREKYDESGNKTVQLAFTIKCVQQFKYLHTEEDLATGEKTDVFATVKKAAKPRGRKRPRPNHNHLQVVEIAKDLYGRDEEYDRKNPAHFAKLEKVRTKAVKKWRKRRRAQANIKRAQQKLSRRINRG